MLARTSAAMMSPYSLGTLGDLTPNPREATPLSSPLSPLSPDSIWATVSPAKSPSPEVSPPQKPASRFPKFKRHVREPEPEEALPPEASVAMDDVLRQEIADVLHVPRM